MEPIYNYRARRRGLWNQFTIIVPGDRASEPPYDYRAVRRSLWHLLVALMMRTAIYSKLLIFILIHFLNIAYTTGFIMY